MLKQQYELVLKQLSSDAEALSRRFPELAVNLSRDNTDPDVARLLEGVALIAARQRELLVQDQNEQMQGWLQAIAPEVLQPIPALVLAAAETPANLQSLAVGTAMVAQSSGQAVHWLVAVDTTLLPWQLETIEQQPREVELKFIATAEFSLPLQALDLYFVGERNESLERLVALKKACKHINLQCGEQSFLLPASALQLKYQVSDGSWLQLLDDRFDSPVTPRWISESWCYSNRMLALSVDLTQLAGVEVKASDECFLAFHLHSPLPITLERRHVAVNVLPLVNLQRAELLPFFRQPQRTLYELALMDETQSMDQLVAIISVSEHIANEALSYFSLDKLALKAETDGIFQLLKQEVVPAVQIRLDRNGDETGLIQVQAFIHQGNLASSLPADTPVIGENVQARLLSRPSRWVAAPNQQQAQWHALQIQQVAAKQLSLDSIQKQLRVLMPPAQSHYDEHRRALRAIEALIGLQVKDTPITRGTSLILGQEITLTMNTAAFGETEVWLLATMLWQWLRARLAINSVLAFRVLSEKGESILYWPHASGTRAVV